MSKRKSKPVRYTQLSGSLDLSDLSSPVPSTSKRNSSSWSDSVKKKKVLTKVPADAKILGEIEFTYADVNLPSSGNYTIVIDDSEENIKYSLVTSQLQTCMPLMSDICPELLSDLLKRQFTWIIKNDITTECFSIVIMVAIKPETTVIVKAENIVKAFFGKEYPSYEEDDSVKLNCTKEFFKELQDHVKHNFIFPDTDVQHEKLLPKLCPYQARAVQWMIAREADVLTEQDVHWMPNVVDQFQSSCGNIFFYNKYSRILFNESLEFPSLPRGGILADEMGLGKTVAAIALILNHKQSIEKDTDSQDFLPAFKTREVTVKAGNEFYVDKDIINKNQEGYLDADEKLICTKFPRNSLRKALNEWYEMKLTAFSYATPSKRRKVDVDVVKCLCGNAELKKEKYVVECPECLRFQHCQCVGFQESFAYFCPSCWRKQKLIKSNGTLIIAPSSIYQQWYDEINRHVRSDTFSNGVFMYNGLKDGFIQPSALSVYDVVITTYEILMSEVHFVVNEDSCRRLRQEERFLKPCSPLTQIQWWRLCLDEAQLIEADVSVPKTMAKLIPAINRWSVTGTPIQRSLKDVFYLVECLGIEPFNSKAIWNNFLYLPYLNGYKTPLYSIISQVFWRSSKDDVQDELLIPPQTMRYHFLKFTAIEQNFYMREHSVSSSLFSAALRRSGFDEDQTLECIDKHSLGKLLIPLLNLRQACSHPQAVRGKHISTNTGSMTLTELLKYLHKKTKVECEEGMRKQIMALNGLAAVACIADEWPRAVEYYRGVLQFAEEYKQKIEVDKLQRIHTLTNLADILQQHKESIPPTLRDDSLREEAAALEEVYMQKVIEEVSTNEKIAEEMLDKVKELEAKFETDQDVWWARLLHFLTLERADPELMDKITAELSTNEKEAKNNVELFLSSISSVKGMEAMLYRWLKNIRSNRKAVLESLNQLRKTAVQSLVNRAVDCHIRFYVAGGEKKKRNCPLCSCESLLLDYECNLFAVSRKKQIHEENDKKLGSTSTKGAWKANNTEKMLRTILNVSKLKRNVEPWCLRDGRNHLQLLDIMKKEFKQLRVVWMSLNHHVLANDEMAMCKMRMRLRLPGEPIPPKPSSLSLSEQEQWEQVLVIEHHEVEPQKMKLTAMMDLSKSEFKKRYGTLLYLENLGQKENAKPDPCPVCKSPLENEWCVLQCGHSYCLDCLIKLIKLTSKSTLSCPVCREITTINDLSFVDLTGKQENSEFSVVGEHSTKVDAIIRTLLELRREDPQVKVLIFSTWQVVLKVLAVGLQQNDISFRKMPGAKNRQQLQEFKDPRKNVTVLLLPISWGSKGLNLTEATHVFLVEPILNPAEELQALGRVHRIGQTRETVVHRFLICGTIEEKIHAAVSEAKDKWDNKKATLKDLSNLFIIKNDFLNRDV